MAYGHPGAFATSVLELLCRGARPRVAARRRAELSSWQHTIERMLAVHGLPAPQYA